MYNFAYYSFNKCDVSPFNRATYPIHRIKRHMGTTDLQGRTMARFVFLIFGVGTPTVIWVKKVRDISYQIPSMKVKTWSSSCAGLQTLWLEKSVLFIPVCMLDNFQTS